MANLDPISILSGLPGWLALMLTVFLLQERRRARKLLETSERVRQGRRKAMKKIRNFVKEVSRLVPTEADGRVINLRNEIVNYLFDSKKKRVSIKYSPVQLQRGEEVLSWAPGAPDHNLRDIKKFLLGKREPGTEFTLQYVSSPEKVFPVGSVGVDSLCVKAKGLLGAVDALKEAYGVIEDFDPTVPDDLEAQIGEYLTVLVNELSKERVLEVEQSMKREEIRESLLTDLFGLNEMRGSYKQLQPYLRRLEKVQSDLVRLI